MSNQPANSPAVPLLAAHDLHKDFAIDGKAVKVLLGVSLSVNRGDFLALRGASGAGKSTLLHLLGGLDAPSSGNILFDGKELSQMSPGTLAELRNRRIGFIFQAYHLLPDLTALENVCIPARMARRNASETQKRASDLLGRVGLSERLGHRPRQLSGGEQQRVAIARALINEPALILADEPTGNLDSHTGAEIIDLLCSLRTEFQTTLVIATHDANIAARAPRVIQMVDGVLAEAKIFKVL
jgi:predicted ABC-type transport system involved in lysophospholipase L1 biosynthesis ATPase subunit